jgi:hypothetical protein
LIKKRSLENSNILKVKVIKIGDVEFYYVLLRIPEKDQVGLLQYSRLFE